METYDDKIRICFRELCKENGGASPSEVTKRMADKGWISPLDSTIDIADIMIRLRNQGLL